MATHKRSLRNRDISILAPPPAPRRSKPVLSITPVVVPSKRQALSTPQAQKRQREQTPPTQQTNMDLGSLDDEEEEPLLRRSHIPSTAISSSTQGRTVMRPPSPLAMPSNGTLPAPLQPMSSVLRLSSPSASYQQRSNIPSLQKLQAQQSAQHIQEPLNQQQSDTPNSRRHPLGTLSPKVASRSWQPNTPQHLEVPSNHDKGKGKSTHTRRRRRFFEWQPAHKALIVWMTTGDNLARAGSKDLAGPQGISGVYEEAAEHVRLTVPNRQNFGGEAARHTIDAIVKRVHMARQETNVTGSGTYGGMTIEEQREAICPGYKDLWPVIRALSDTKFAERTKSSLPPIPLYPKPLASLPHTSLTLQPPPPAVAAIVADAENIESEGIGVSLCPCTIPVIIGCILMPMVQSRLSSDGEADCYIDPDDGLGFVDSDIERSSVSGPSRTSPKAADLIADANAIANKLSSFLDKYDADGERQSDARLKDALYLYKDQRERVVQLEKKVEELQEKNNAQQETNCQLRIVIERLKSERAVANE